MSQSIGLIAIASAIVLLALWGFGSFDADHVHGLLDRLYLVLGLFVLEGEWTRAPDLPWQLELARFAAPIVTIASLLFVLVRGFRERALDALVLLARDHQIVVGLHDAAWPLVRSLAARAERTVVVDDTADDDAIAICHELGVRVIKGDPLSESTLRRAGIRRAQRLIAFHRDDGVNVELATRLKQWLAAPRPAAPLRMHVHVAATGLAERLEEYPKFFADQEVVEVNFFNLDELTARALFRSEPWERYADGLKLDRLHAVIFGSGALAEQIALAFARNAHYAGGQPPRLTLVAPDGAGLARAFQLRNPYAEHAASIGFCDVPSYSAEHLLGLRDDRFGAASLFVVCIGADDVENLQIAFGLRRRILRRELPNAPIAVYLAHSRGLARLLEAEPGGREVPDGLLPFGMLEQVMSADNVVDQQHDALARALHESYLADAHPSESSPSAQPWSHLPEVYRNENRLQADHIDVKLRALRRVVNRGRAVAEFGDDEVERLARMEKQRWIACRSLLGWRVGHRRNDLAKTHDLMRRWDELDESEREPDRAGVRAIPTLLGDRLEQSLAREVIIGVTGHRPPRVNPGDAAIGRAIRATLDALRDLYPDAALAIMSPLADGGDRMFADIALERGDIRLYVPLPLPYEIYIQDFFGADADAQQASIREFEQLLGRAHHYFELPIGVGSIEEMSGDEPQAVAARARQYASLGAYLVDRCDELVAIWDGQPSPRPGGTAQVIDWRLRGVPDPLRWPSHFYARVERRAPFLIPVPAPEHFRPARIE